ncbi:PREDICTED: exopolygalacturonase clone GBGA483-like [Tarenaya hassleriana]|uniref:exopolygalacturonase clone GBGA483-like n=1 Tax=Tarenaya hassleriana TaxID=28532 RepID=UPI00053C4966|nr:PREDICTED: exopolygalacturonase clone GBGA483-like [Tarenaya hassleriana]
MVGLRRTRLVVLIAVALVVNAVTAADAAVVNVRALGAKGDGRTDDTAAFAAAWKQACGATGKSTITVGKGEYLVTRIDFNGPCKGPVTVELLGNLKAPAEVTKTEAHGGWVNFGNLVDFTLNGHGSILDGQGALAWKKNDCAKTGKCNNLPINVRFTGLTNSRIRSITSSNSKLFHMNILNCKNITLEDIGIDAPPESLNTDGIHIGRSNGVNLLGAHVRTGDDCVSIGDGSENLVIENVRCGPGHGIAIGSLGRYPNEQPVRGVHVRHCTISNTMNGVRIKTWPASPAGIASNLHFEDIVMENVGTPILVDQEYCPYNHCKRGSPSMVKISDVSFKNIRGTSSTKTAVKLVCSKGVPCSKVELSDINLTYNGKDGPAVSECANVKPILSGKIIPAACTAPHKPLA